MEICVVGAGHVGLVTAACFADLGHSVICVDQDEQKIRDLKKGKVWFYEPRLSPLVVHNAQKKRLSFTTRVREGVKRSTLVFIAVGTPPLESGEADLSAVEQVVSQIVQAAPDYRLIVEKSTVPVETGRRIREVLEMAGRKKVPLEVASNPEFLREGCAVDDFFRPDRIVLGVESKKAETLLKELYKPFKVPLVVTDIESAELIKHASNAFLATKISFINAVATLCERVGADVEKVALGMGMDSRIGPAFLKAGAGYGGFCFPKDLEAFIRIAEKLGYPFELLKATQRINERQREIVVEKVEKLTWNLKGKKVGLLGLAFKPDTDDLRFAPALEVIDALLAKGASVQAFDPQALGPARQLLGRKISYAKDPYALARGSHCLVLMTEWNEFKELDFARIKRLMKSPFLVDGRNLYDPALMRRIGFRYESIGRGRVG